MKRVKITQTRSGIGMPLRQKRTLESLGLIRIRHTVEHDATRQSLGMINKVKHLVVTEEV